MSRLTALFLCVVTALAAAPSVAEAAVVHIVRQGDTITSLATEYYGEASRATILRAVNQMPQEGEVELVPGEPILIPELRRRIVGEDETWADLAQAELGAPDRGWYVASVNGVEDGSAPSPGRIVTIPYLMPLALTEGLAATVAHFYPLATGRDRIRMARLLIRLNPGLRPRGMARGTRVVLPFTDLVIIPAAREALDRAQAARRTEADQERQQEASSQLERLPALLAAGSYAELVLLAGRIAGGSELTEAQRVTLQRYLGQAFLALDRQDLAVRAFVELLGMQPDFQFDQVTTSPRVIELLSRAREQLQSNSESTSVNQR